MKLKSVKDGYSSLCTPVDSKDFALFKHCTDGQLCCLKERVFNGDVGELLLVHGVHSIEMVEEPKKQINLGHNYNGDDICRSCGHSKDYAESNKVKCFKNKLVKWYK
jgi:hypothetical protein